MISIADINTVHTAIAAAKQDPPTITVASNHGARAVASEPLIQMTETEHAKLQVLSLVSMKKKPKTSLNKKDLV